MKVRSQASVDERSQQVSLDCDVLVIGSGAAGLMAALSARYEGADVVVLEKEAVFGGTSALSGGWLWVPESAVAKRAGMIDSIAQARRYIQHEAGIFFDPERVDAFLHSAPEMVDFCERHTRLRFLAAPTFPDYHPTVPGASYGRSICAQPFDARQLGQSLSLLRRPLRALTFMGMAVSSGAELRHFMHATRSMESAMFVARRLARHAADVALHRRGMRLTNGNALMASLLASARDAGVRMYTQAHVLHLIRDDDAIAGVHVQWQKQALNVHVRQGVILATGGFAHDAKRLQASCETLGSSAVWPMPPAGNTGDGIRMAETVGAQFIDQVAQPAAWVPTSVVEWPDGERGGYIHVIDRAKPGVIAVTRGGQRFVNEASPYHDFVAAMLQVRKANESVEAFLICDHNTLRRYGLGFVKPFPVPFHAHLQSGYLMTGNSLEDLAQSTGIDSASLALTVAQVNADVEVQRDSQFGKGESEYDRYMGDADAKEHPCLAPVKQGPFYAIRVIPGCLSTYAGLATDSRARVLRSSGEPIEGLYAIGSDMLTITGGGYLGAGANLGPGMTFGYLAGRELGRKHAMQHEPVAVSEGA